jgi:hypothetical protein
MLTKGHLARESFVTDPFYTFLTDLFTLLKVDEEWKITNKVFHLHS